MANSRRKEKKLRAPSKHSLQPLRLKLSWGLGFRAQNSVSFTGFSAQNTYNLYTFMPKEGNFYEAWMLRGNTEANMDGA